MYMNYRPKFGPVGKLVNALMIKPMTRRTLSNVLEGLDRHVVTGEHVGKNGAPILQRAEQEAEQAVV